MNTIDAQQLEGTLEEVLRRTSLGEWFTVLQHGVPIARLGPPSAPGVRVGLRFATDDFIAPMGRCLTRGAYLVALAEDRGSESR